MAHGTVTDISVNMFYPRWNNNIDELHIMGGMYMLFWKETGHCFRDEYLLYASVEYKQKIVEKKTTF